jgi:hypothetical protein
MLRFISMNFLVALAGHSPKLRGHGHPAYTKSIPSVYPPSALVVSSSFQSTVPRM